MKKIKFHAGLPPSQQLTSYKAFDETSEQNVVRILFRVVLNIKRIFFDSGRVAEVARPPVAASAGAPALAGSPSIRAFVAKSEIHALLDIPFSAIHGHEWLFHDYDASAGCQR